MSFARILRSSAIMGGAQVVTLATAFIRTKVVAQLMGPAGVGLAGILTAFNGNVSTLAAWGLGTSGVRLIASAPRGQTACTQAAVRKFGTTLTWLGFWATVLLFLPVSYLTFGTGQYALELLIGGMAVPCIIANSIWGSILQAAGHVKSLAKGQILSALIGLFLGLPSFIFLVALESRLASSLLRLPRWHSAGTSRVKIARRPAPMLCRPTCAPYSIWEAA